MEKLYFMTAIMWDISGEGIFGYWCHNVDSY